MIEPQDVFEPSPNTVRPQPDGRRWFWSDAQRRALAGLTLIAACILGLSLLRHPTVITDPPRPYPERYDELKDRINPNTASASELAVLPGIGPARAQAIVDYRATQPAPAFREPRDLARVRGIGEVTAMKLVDHVYFEDAPPDED